MYLGNSRLLLGKTTNQKMLGEWLAIAPSTASSGTYGIDTGVGYCSEIFNGYLYVGGDISTLINNTSQTTSLNNLIKYNLQVTSSTWENALDTNISSIQSLRSIGDGDHLLLGGGDGLFYLTGVGVITPTEVEDIVGFTLGPISGISNAFTSINLNGTTFSHTSNNYLCVIGEFFGTFPGMYNGSTKKVSFFTSQNSQVLDSYVTSPNSGKVLILKSGGSILGTSGGYTTYNSNSPNVNPGHADGEYFQCMISMSTQPNKIYIAGGSESNKIHVFNHSSGVYQSPIDLGVTIQPITLNTVVYNDINYLIVGGREGIIIVDPEDTSEVKEVPIPDDDADIRSISVDSDSTIYVTGNFSFPDKNGVTAKNVAKFVPDASKLP